MTTMDWTKKTVLVVGTGISGVAATELLLKNGSRVILFDGNQELDAAALKEKNPQLTEVEIILGTLIEEDLKRIDLAVCRVAGFLFLENAFYAVKDSIPPCAFLMIFQIVIEICFYFVVLSLHHDGEHACLKVNRSYEVGIEFGKYGIGRVVCAAEVYAE